jgi:hypothetical protein
VHTRLDCRLGSLSSGSILVVGRTLMRGGKARTLMLRAQELEAFASAVVKYPAEETHFLFLLDLYDPIPSSLP